MMKCHSYKEDITAWLDRELGPQKDRDMRFHLDSCPSCREELNCHLTDRRWWNSLPKEAEPTSLLWQKILLGLREEPASWNQRWILAVRSIFMPDFSFSWSRSLAMLGLAGLFLLSSSLLLFYPSADSFYDPSTAVLMEDYLRWRAQEADKLHRPLSKPLSIHELKANNPFLDSHSSSPPSNPFISG